MQLLEATHAAFQWEILFLLQMIIMCVSCPRTTSCYKRLKKLKKVFFSFGYQCILFVFVIIKTVHSGIELGTFDITVLSLIVSPGAKTIFKGAIITAPAIPISPMLSACCCFQYRHGHRP